MCHFNIKNRNKNRMFILFKHIQLITITYLQNAWIIYIYSRTIIVNMVINSQKFKVLE